MAFIALCLVTAVISLTTYASVHRRFFAYDGALFLSYAVETCEIFFNEYLGQNVVFPAESYYDVGHPLVRTAVAVVSQACVWLIVLDLLEHENRLRDPLSWVPPLAFFISSLLVVCLVPKGAWRQWSYYILRTVFSLFSLGYLGVGFAKLPEGRLKMTLGKHRKLYVLVVALAALVAVEDTLVILVIPASGELADLYLSERNFTENILAMVYAVFLLRYASSVLSVRMGEPPRPESESSLERAIHEHMPRYQEAHGLSNREAEVLALVLQGKSNQEIADELVLALGTIKTHVHNIMKKCDQPSREALTLDFWRS